MAYPHHPTFTIETRETRSQPRRSSPQDPPPPFHQATGSPATENSAPLLHTRHAADTEHDVSNGDLDDNVQNIQDLHPQDSHDEELPSYAALENLPTYDQSALAHPFALFTLRGFTRKTQLLIPAAACIAEGQPCYKLSFRTAPRIFTRKPDIILTAANSLISPNTGAVALAAGGEEELGKAEYETGGGTGAWYPRARIMGTKVAPGTTGGLSPSNTSDEKLNLPMESRNFVDWSFSAEDVGIDESLESGSSRRRFTWKLLCRPTAFVLVSEPDGEIVARFTHSTVGTMAKNGGEVGELAIYSSHSALIDDEIAPPPSPTSLEIGGADCPGFIPLVLTLAVTMFNLRRMGRHHWNDEEGRRRSSLGNGLGRGLAGVSGRTASVTTMPLMHSTVNTQAIY